MCNTYINIYRHICNIFSPIGIYLISGKILKLTWYIIGCVSKDWVINVVKHTHLTGSLRQWKLRFRILFWRVNRLKVEVKEVWGLSILPNLEKRSLWKGHIYLHTPWKQMTHKFVICALVLWNSWMPSPVLVWKLSGCGVAGIYFLVQVGISFFLVCNILQDWMKTIETRLQRWLLKMNFFFHLSEVVRFDSPEPSMVIQQFSIVLSVTSILEFLKGYTGGYPNPYKNQSGRMKLDVQFFVSHLHTCHFPLKKPFPRWFRFSKHVPFWFPVGVVRSWRSDWQPKITSKRQGLEWMSLILGGVLNVRPASNSVMVKPPSPRFWRCWYGGTWTSKRLGMVREGILFGVGFSDRILVSVHRKTCKEVGLRFTRLKDQAKPWSIDDFWDFWYLDLVGLLVRLLTYGVCLFIIIRLKAEW